MDCDVLDSPLLKPKQYTRADFVLERDRPFYDKLPTNWELISEFKFEPREDETGTGYALINPRTNNLAYFFAIKDFDETIRYAEVTCIRSMTFFGDDSSDPDDFGEDFLYNSDSSLETSEEDESAVQSGGKIETEEEEISIQEIEAPLDIQAREKFVSELENTLLELDGIGDRIFKENLNTNKKQKKNVKYDNAWFIKSTIALKKSELGKLIIQSMSDVKKDPSIIILITQDAKGENLNLVYTNEETLLSRLPSLMYASDPKSLANLFELIMADSIKPDFKLTFGETTEIFSNKTEFELNSRNIISPDAIIIRSIKNKVYVSVSDFSTTMAVRTDRFGFEQKMIKMSSFKYLLFQYLLSETFMTPKVLFPIVASVNANRLRKLSQTMNPTLDFDDNHVRFSFNVDSISEEFTNKLSQHMQKLVSKNFDYKNTDEKKCVVCGQNASYFNMGWLCDEHYKYTLIDSQPGFTPQPITKSDYEELSKFQHHTDISELSQKPSLLKFFFGVPIYSQLNDESRLVLNQLKLIQDKVHGLSSELNFDHVPITIKDDILIGLESLGNFVVPKSGQLNKWKLLLTFSFADVKQKHEQEIQNLFLRYDHCLPYGLSNQTKPFSFKKLDKLINFKNRSELGSLAMKDTFRSLNTNRDFILDTKTLSDDDQLVLMSQNNNNITLLMGFVPLQFCLFSDIPVSWIIRHNLWVLSRSFSPMNEFEKIKNQYHLIEFSGLDDNGKLDLINQPVLLFERGSIQDYLWKVNFSNEGCSRRSILKFEQLANELKFDFDTIKEFLRSTHVLIDQEPVSKVRFYSHEHLNNKIKDSFKSSKIKQSEHSNDIILLLNYLLDKEDLNCNVNKLSRFLNIINCFELLKPMSFMITSSGDLISKSSQVSETFDLILKEGYMFTIDIMFPRRFHSVYHKLKQLEINYEDCVKNYKVKDENTGINWGIYTKIANSIELISKLFNMPNKIKNMVMELKTSSKDMEYIKEVMGSSSDEEKTKFNSLIKDVFLIMNQEPSCNSTLKNFQKLILMITTCHGQCRDYMVPITLVRNELVKQYVNSGNLPASSFEKFPAVLEMSPFCKFVSYHVLNVLILDSIKQMVFWYNSDLNVNYKGDSETIRKYFNIPQGVYRIRPGTDQLKYSPIIDFGCKNNTFFQFSILLYSTIGCLVRYQIDEVKYQARYSDTKDASNVYSLQINGEPIRISSLTPNANKLLSKKFQDLAGRVKTQVTVTNNFISKPLKDIRDTKVSGTPWPQSKIGSYRWNVIDFDQLDALKNIRSGDQSNCFGKLRCIAIPLRIISEYEPFLLEQYTDFEIDKLYCLFSWYGADNSEKITTMYMKHFLKKINKEPNIKEKFIELLNNIQIICDSADIVTLTNTALNKQHHLKSLDYGSQIFNLVNPHLQMSLSSGSAELIHLIKQLEHFTFIKNLNDRINALSDDQVLAVMKILSGGKPILNCNLTKIDSTVYKDSGLIEMIKIAKLNDFATSKGILLYASFKGLNQKKLNKLINTDTVRYANATIDQYLNIQNNIDLTSPDYLKLSIWQKFALTGYFPKEEVKVRGITAASPYLRIILNTIEEIAENVSMLIKTDLSSKIDEKKTVQEYMVKDLRKTDWHVLYDHFYFDHFENFIPQYNKMEQFNIDTLNCPIYPIYDTSFSETDMITLDSWYTSCVRKSGLSAVEVKLQELLDVLTYKEVKRGSVRKFSKDPKISKEEEEQRNTLLKNTSTGFFIQLCKTKWFFVKINLINQLMHAKIQVQNTYKVFSDYVLIHTDLTNTDTRLSELVPISKPQIVVALKRFMRISSVKSILTKSGGIIDNNIISNLQKNFRTKTKICDFNSFNLNLFNLIKVLGESQIITSKLRITTPKSWCPTKEQDVNKDDIVHLQDIFRDSNLITKLEFKQEEVSYTNSKFELLDGTNLEPFIEIFKPFPVCIDIYNIDQTGKGFVLFLKEIQSNIKYHKEKEKKKKLDLKVESKRELICMKSEDFFTIDKFTTIVKKLDDVESLLNPNKFLDVQHLINFDFEANVRMIKLIRIVKELQHQINIYKAKSIYQEEITKFRMLNLFGLSSKGFNCRNDYIRHIDGALYEKGSIRVDLWRATEDKSRFCTTVNSSLSSLFSLSIKNPMIRDMYIKFLDIWNKKSYFLPPICNCLRELEALGFKDYSDPLHLKPLMKIAADPMNKINSDFVLNGSTMSQGMLGKTAGCLTGLITDIIDQVLMNKSQFPDIIYDTLDDYNSILNSLEIDHSMSVDFAMVNTSDDGAGVLFTHFFNSKKLYSPLLKFQTLCNSVCDQYFKLCSFFGIKISQVKSFYFLTVQMQEFNSCFFEFNGEISNIIFNVYQQALNFEGHIGSLIDCLNYLRMKGGIIMELHPENDYFMKTMLNYFDDFMFALDIQEPMNEVETIIHDLLDPNFYGELSFRALTLGLIDTGFELAQLHNPTSTNPLVNLIDGILKMKKSDDDYKQFLLRLSYFYLKENKLGEVSKIDEVRKRTVGKFYQTLRGQISNETMMQFISVISDLSQLDLYSQLGKAQAYNKVYSEKVSSSLYVDLMQIKSLTKNGPIITIDQLYQDGTTALLNLVDMVKSTSLPELREEMVEFENSYNPNNALELTLMPNIKSLDYQIVSKTPNSNLHELKRVKTDLKNLFQEVFNFLSPKIKSNARYLPLDEFEKFLSTLNEHGDLVQVFKLIVDSDTELSNFNASRTFDTVQDVFNFFLETQKGRTITICGTKSIIISKLILKWTDFGEWFKEHLEIHFSKMHIAVPKEKVLIKTVENLITPTLNCPITEKHKVLNYRSILQSFDDEMNRLTITIKEKLSDNNITNSTVLLKPKNIPNSDYVLVSKTLDFIRSDDSIESVDFIELVEITPTKERIDYTIKFILFNTLDVNAIPDIITSYIKKYYSKPKWKTGMPINDINKLLSILKTLDIMFTKKNNDLLWFKNTRGLSPIILRTRDIIFKSRLNWHKHKLTNKFVNNEYFTPFGFSKYSFGDYHIKNISNEVIYINDIHLNNGKKRYLNYQDLDYLTRIGEDIDLPDEAEFPKSYNPLLYEWPYVNTKQMSIESAFDYPKILNEAASQASKDTAEMCNQELGNSMDSMESNENRLPVATIDFNDDCLDCYAFGRLHKISINDHLVTQNHEISIFDLDLLTSFNNYSQEIKERLIEDFLD